MTLRASFDEDAERYDRARPGYPHDLFDDLAALAGLQPRSRVLELGCGTGQATVPLARRGYEVAAVELGPKLAEVARRKLAAFPSVHVVNAEFEQWPLPTEPFDLVVAATSFHWLDPSLRLAKSAEALRPGGTLAVISTHHVAGGDAEFFATVQGCYERWMPGTPPGLDLPTAAEVPPGTREFERDGRFGEVGFRRYEQELTYTTSEYLDLIQTYSGHRALAADAREALLACIAQLIDLRFGGRIAKRSMTELTFALTRRLETGAGRPATAEKL
jgi:SAM-dependent methyltransferase